MIEVPGYLAKELEAEKKVKMEFKEIAPIKIAVIRFQI